MTKRIALTAALAATLACARPAETPAGDAAQPPSVEALEAAVAENPLKDAWFGEQHLHTAYSLDAYLGGTRLTPSDMPLAASAPSSNRPSVP